MDASTPIQEQMERAAVGRAKDTLVKQAKPLEAGRMVAELSFGFWTSLLDVRYERSNVLWPHLLRPTFPRMRNRDRKRKTISARINSIRLLRNRVSHHEPIWHWRDLMWRRGCSGGRLAPRRGGCVCDAPRITAAPQPTHLVRAPPPPPPAPTSKLPAEFPAVLRCWRDTRHTTAHHCGQNPRALA